ncbi:unnamed protein product [Parnassius mnemosyne]|uniref:Proteasome assembly chaperone 1 n=1 Tax=Parnassius mnemosyne TaxID=213953 RepID=A0AAV1KSG7_9NEOP
MSLFGEVVEPISRNIWEDWDEIIIERDDSNSKLHWDNEVVINKTIDSFYLLDGKYLKQFVNTTHLQLINTVKEVNLNIYEIHTHTHNKYICTIMDYNLILSSEIVQLLQPYFEFCKNVLTVQCISMSEYRTNQLNIQPCLIRGIYTSKALNTSELDIPKLEQPNILSGVPAGVITLRQHLDQMGIALICYVEYTEDYQIEELQKLLHKLEIGSNIQKGPSIVLNSNLYI